MVGLSGFSQVETGMLGNFWSCLKGVKDLSRLKREGGISFEMLQHKRASSRIEGRLSWCFSDFDRKLGVPFEL